MRRLCVYCGSSLGSQPGHREATRLVGAELARRGWGLVYGGASVGLMGALADSALQCGAEVIGILPRSLQEREIAHPGLTQLRVVDSMHERKAAMASLSDAFLALPGGWGTLDELCEVVTWRQLGHHTKPCALLNSHGFFNGFLQHLDAMVADGFSRLDHRTHLLIDTETVPLLDAIEREAGRNDLSTHR